MDKFGKKVKLLISISITIVILLINSMKIYDFLNSQKLTAEYYNGYFLVKKNDIQIKANHYQEKIYKNKQKVTILYNPYSKNIILYNKFKYFFSFIISLSLLYIIWFLFYKKGN